MEEIHLYLQKLEQCIQKMEECHNEQLKQVESFVETYIQSMDVSFEFKSLLLQYQKQLTYLQYDKNHFVQQCNTLLQETVLDQSVKSEIRKQLLHKALDCMEKENFNKVEQILLLLLEKAE